MRGYLWTALLAGWTHAAGCAATGDTGGGAEHLPTSGLGAYTLLEPNPFVLIDPSGDLDEPSVVAQGEQLIVFVNAGSSIARAQARTLAGGFGALQPILRVDRDWEGVAVSGAAVIRGSGGAPWLLFYLAGG